MLKFDLKLGLTFKLKIFFKSGYLNQLIKKIIIREETSK